jgi:hypothetical protein
MERCSMTQQRLHSALAPIDVLTRIEMEELLNKNMEAAERTRVRGVDYMEVNGNAANATSVAIQGPDQGYAWSLKIASAVLSAAATLNVYLGDNQNTAPVGSVILAAAGAAIVTWTSNIVIIRDARFITLASSVAGIGAWKIIAKQVPNEMVGKL